MKLLLQLKTNEGLFLRNPEHTTLGKKIIKSSIELIDKFGFEAFTFKKLAAVSGTTEASVYRYFENKHYLLIYIITWYWGWLEFQINYQTNNIQAPITKLKKIIRLLTSVVEDDESTDYVNEKLLHRIVISEGSKTYLTKQVTEDNKHQFFKPYKDICAIIADIISDCNPQYKYPRCLATTIIEMAHFQNFFMNNLPSLTDFTNQKDDTKVAAFLEDMMLNIIKP